ncbi:MAG: HIT domain-containing protein, partial [Verrucomicrobia bacterium]|nr:HIT domain-containing protein [Verrucomicrobiota bacterium]
MPPADPCPFCHPDPDRLMFETDGVIGLRDGFPVSPGHALVIPRRHIATWFDASREDQVALLDGIERARREILKRHRPDGFNIGINAGTAAGQTVFHLHIHVIPRYTGDLSDPRGGVRHVIPQKANYLKEPPSSAVDTGALPHQGALIHGDDDPLLPHFLAHLDRAVAADLCVAFVQRSGLNLVREHLRDLLKRRGRVRILTGDYLDITDPQALLELMDLADL